MRPANIDRAAVAAIRSERIDWRFKGMPASAFGATVGELAARRPRLFADGFVGPLVVIGKPALEHNLRTMAEWCARHGLALAPHGKTTMAPQLFAAQLDAGAWAITAATASQLRVYRAFGVSRVVFANELVDAAALRWVADELDRDPDFEFVCWVDSTRGVELMTEALADRRSGRPVDVAVELGASGGRSGVREVSEGVAVAEAVAASPALRLVGVAGYEGALAHETSGDALSTVDTYLRRLRELVVLLAEAGHFAGLDRVFVSAGGSSYFDQVAAAFTEPWPGGLDVLPVLRSGAYLTHDDGLYRRLSPFGREHRLSGGEPPFRPALRAWAQVCSRPEPGLALLTLGRRDVSFDQDLPEPRALRPAGGPERPLTGCRVTALADQHAFLEVGAGVELAVGDWVGLGLSHPCTVFDKWPLVPVVDEDGETVVDLVRTYF
ncbi:D-serine deaminase, pyridoxal phosphate-dependent [Streptoalloteichus tenebrarius]|uniref:D-serine deaminase, pyridoxal phosphate-dependent n=1 Tax=Streptoalloteichus tenebrarius (strain ATCC 17920 / DSM 40477 / JCM 4838 / CBS 697.72 / NBRC 16177 / NCIMB 11028 / NRRL B-12390 / A12253. 1 / ISP 5477) TaxID=1933 RepID=A0ABT1HSI5_STRSD|nr:amino acid deaminase [Streptoalloteichus tenebrarius]MCP2258466.1 D-serine deaminase, pyridoxal phosphate-dependent [Streptoalloteichus tenebrarius]BFF03638.1 amino acid deaminase [Streptoalloteichus tenebrarius]